MSVVLTPPFQYIFAQLEKIAALQIQACKRGVGRVVKKIKGKHRKNCVKRAASWEFKFNTSIPLIFLSSLSWRCLGARSHSVLKF